MQVTAQGALQLGNQGDTLVLVDPSGASIDQVTYKADRVRSGQKDLHRAFTWDRTWLSRL